MTFFILSLVSFAVVSLIFIFKIKKYSYLGIIFLFALILTVILIYSMKVRPYSVRGVESSYKEIILFVSMLMGMLTSTIIKSSKGNRFKIKTTDLLKPLFIAPIIFFAIWGAVERMVEFSFITCCFAYTNGFFWESILKNVRTNIEKKIKKDISIPE